MSRSSDINGVVALIERIAAAADRIGHEDVFSVRPLTAHHTGKNGTFLTPPDITTEMIGAWVSRALHKRVGIRRPYAVSEQASLIGSSEKTIQKYMAGETPSTANLFRLIAFHGPEFASEILAPLGMAVVESDSVQAAQALSVGNLMDMLPQLRNLAETLEDAMRGEGDEHG